MQIRDYHKNLGSNLGAFKWYLLGRPIGLSLRFYRLANKYHMLAIMFHRLAIKFQRLAIKVHTLAIKFIG